MIPSKLLRQTVAFSASATLTVGLLGSGWALAATNIWKVTHSAIECRAMCTGLPCATPQPFGIQAGSSIHGAFFNGTTFPMFVACPVARTVDEEKGTKYFDPTIAKEISFYGVSNATGVLLTACRTFSDGDFGGPTGGKCGAPVVSTPYRFTATLSSSAELAGWHGGGASDGYFIEVVLPSDLLVNANGVGLGLPGPAASIISYTVY